MQYILQNNEIIELENIVLDLNGTLAVGGKIVPGVHDRIVKLQDSGFHIFLSSGDQRGNGEKIADELGIEFSLANSALEKSQIWNSIDPEKSVAIGNARIDIGLFEKSRISILTLQSEGIHVGTLQYADILIPSICDALDLFLEPDRLLATMKI